MKVLTIGTDTSVFDKASEARRRISAYGTLFDELHIIIYTKPGFYKEKISENIFLYPTNASFAISHPFHALRLGQKIIRQRKITFISVQDPAESGLAGWLLKRRTHLPLHIQVHTDIFSLFFRKSSWKEYLRYRIARLVLPHGDRIRAVSHRIKASLITYVTIDPRLIHVLPIFVDRQAIAVQTHGFDLRQRHPEHDFIILMVSRLTREKNIPLALNAFRELVHVYPNSGLFIVGDGPDRQKLLAHARNLRLVRNVHFEGWQQDVVSYYKTADLYVLTSDFEGYGRSVVEAAAAGIPIAMSDVGVAGEVIRDGESGMVFPVGDGARLAEVLLDARKDPARARSMAELAQRRVLAMPPLNWQEYLVLYRESFV